MSTLRSRLRLWATAWLVFQAASLAALAPGACCAVDRPAHAERDRHESAGAARCPMPAADGTACPMHRAKSGGSGPGSPAAARMTGCPCDGSTLFTLIATPGVLSEGPGSFLCSGTRPHPAAPAGDPRVMFRRPDPPPPRA